MYLICLFSALFVVVHHLRRVEPRHREHRLHPLPRRHRLVFTTLGHHQMLLEGKLLISSIIEFE